MLAIHVIKDLLVSYCRSYRRDVTFSSNWTEHLNIRIQIITVLGTHYKYIASYIDYSAVSSSANVLYTRVHYIHLS